MMRIASQVFATLALVAALLAPSPARALCPGDCDTSGAVSINELVRGVNIALNSLPVSACTAFDRDSSGSVSISELIAAVNAALDGCPPESATPTPTQAAETPTPSVTPTSTVSIEPIFPANYRDSFVEVRDCRLGIEHRSRMIRVLANSIGAEAYRRLENPLPLGSIIIKEEYDGIDCSNDAELINWSVMRKESPGFDPDDGDWRWQQVDAPSRFVSCNDKACPGFACIGCHQRPECVARDYMCTEDDTPRGTLHPVLENLPAAVLSISGRSPTDVYAVGGDPDDGSGPLVLHYDGDGWQRLNSGASGTLWWISVTPIAGDFYMVGENGLILLFDPDDKQFTRASATPDSTSTLFGIWGPAANDLWAVGGDTENQAVVWHYDGENWTAVDVSGILPDGVPTTLNKVFGRAANDIYAVGETGVILHYDGAWSLVPRVSDSTLFTVHGGGSLLAAVGGFQLGTIIERQDNGSFLSRTPSNTPRLNGVFVPPSGDAVAVGINLAVAARTSSGWSVVNEGTDPALRDFHAVWIDPDDGIWAVGGNLALITNGVLSYGGPQTVVGGPIQ